MKTLKLLALLMLAITISFCIIVWFYPPTDDFVVGNPFWNGLSVYSNEAKAVPLKSYNNLPSSARGTALIVIPYEPFTAVELAQLNNYVSSGGTLVLMDDYGFGNQVLSGLGLNMRFTGQPLLDPLYNYKNEWLPKITNFANSTVTSNVTSIVLNHATCLNSTSGATVIASSSSFSFLDVKDSGTWDSSDPTGPFPYAAYEKMGEGYVVAVADPSIMINSMIEMGSNLQFIENVVRLAGSSPQIFIDQGHLPQAPLDAAKTDLNAVYAVTSSPIVTLSLIVVIVVISLHSIWRRGWGHPEEKQ